MADKSTKNDSKKDAKKSIKKASIKDATAKRRSALKKEYKKYKHQIGLVLKTVVSVLAVGVIGLLGWIFATQLTLTPSERVAEAFRDATRLDSYEIQFEIAGSAGENTSNLTGIATVEDELSFTTHSALINEDLNFAFDVFRNNSEDIEEQQSLTRYTNSDIFVTQLGLDEQEVTDEDFDQVVDVWVSAAGQVPFIDVAQTIAAVNYSDAPWEDGIIDAAETDKTRTYNGEEAVAYDVSVDVEVLNTNLDELDEDGQQELLGAYGVPEDTEVTDEQFEQFVVSVVESYERINDSNLVVWLDGSRLVAITAQDVAVQNSQFDEIELVYLDKGASVTVEPVADNEIITQQEFIDRLGELQPELAEDQPANVDDGQADTDDS